VFTRGCTRCSDCITACPERILISGSGGFPEIDFTSGACTFCGACADACAGGALVRVAGEPPWHRIAAIGNSCLVTRGVSCRVCEDACDAGAIRFSPASRARPVIDAVLCTGCGACVRPCPVQTLTVTHSIRDLASCP
jgi:ferredoxin-type protein NapF